MKSRLKNLWPIWWLIGVWFFSFLPLLFFRLWIHWDMILYSYPQYLFLNDAFRSGEIPLWNPFHFCGFPVLSNFQWYPLTQLLIWIPGVSLKSLQYWLLFHILFAGMTAYYLARKFQLSQAASCLAATGYMLCGLFTGNTEHIYVLTTYVWLPLVLAGIQGWLTEKRAGDLWLFGAGLVLILTGGYSGTNLIALLFAGLFLAAGLAEQFSFKGPAKTFKEDIYPLGFSALVAALIAGAQVVPIFFDIGNYSNRAGGMEYHRSLEENLLPVWTLISLFVPTADFPPILDTYNASKSLSMLNCYMGIICLCLALFAIHTRRERIVLILAVLGMAALLAAFGSQSFLRGALYEFVPGFRLFRHPALFRGVFLLFFCLLAGFGMDELLKAKPDHYGGFQRGVLILTVTLGVTLGGAAVAALAVARIEYQAAIILRKVFLQSLPIQISVLLALYFWLRGSRRHLAVGLLMLSTLDLTFMAQANMFLIGSPMSEFEHMNLINKVARRHRKVAQFKLFNLKDNWNDPINRGMVFKEFQTYAYEPFVPQAYFQVMNTGFHQVLPKFPRYFLVQQVSMAGDLDQALKIFERAGKDQTMPVMVEGLPPAGIKIASDAEFRLDQMSYQSIKVTDYSLKRVKMEFNNQAPALLASTEAYHPGWLAMLDGKKIKTEKVNFAFRGIYVLDPGQHTLIWKFRPRSFYYGTLTSLAGFALMILAVLLKLGIRPANH